MNNKKQKFKFWFTVGDGTNAKTNAKRYLKKLNKLKEYK